MNITLEDRRITSAQAAAIDSRCALTDVQRVAMTAVRTALQPVEQRSTGLQLGQHIRTRWTPSSSTETRSLKTALAAAKKHTARLSDALGLASVPAVTATLTSIMQDAAPDDYDDNSRVANQIAGAPDWASNLVDWLAQPAQANQDPADVADRTASDAAVQITSASTLDDIDSSGGTQYRMVPEDGACKVCEATAGVYDLDDDSGMVPVHGNCTCTVEAVK